MDVWRAARCTLYPRLPKCLPSGQKGPSCCSPGPQFREMGCVVSYMDWMRSTHQSMLCGELHGLDEEHSPSSLSFVGVLALV